MKKSKKLIIKCAFCSKEIKVSPYILKTRKNVCCSRECAVKVKRKINNGTLNKLTKDFLIEEYVKKHKGATTIAKELNINFKWIYKKLREYGIRIRKPNEYRKYKEPPRCCVCGKILSSRKYKRCHKCNNKYLAEQTWFCKLKSESAKKAWKDEEKRKRIAEASIKAVNKRPNKSEEKLKNILSELFPNDYEYVGNGKVIIEGYCPDFINTNGKKKIIELFGCYWHKCKECGYGNEKLTARDRKRIKIYRKYGYESLIIWGHELENIDRLKDKIISFNGGKNVANGRKSKSLVI